jgi:uncharacterized membrane protein YeaQ/YmgE (transglycosylase-associated protein family)
MVDIMGTVLWLITGGVAGWIASIVLGPATRQDVILNVVVGIFGAFIGGRLLVPLLGVGSPPSGITVMSFIVPLIGAILLLTLLRLFRRSYTP